MIATDVNTKEFENGWYLHAKVLSDRLANGYYDLEFLVEGANRRGDSSIGDALVAALLLPAMALDEELTVGESVSARLLDRVPDIAAIYRAWTLGTSGGTVIASPLVTEHRRGVGDAVFFSGGTDSFYSLLKHLPRGQVSRLVFISGFDIPLGNPLLESAISSVRRVAMETGVDVVTITTNLRSLSEPIVGWGAYHGAVLASAGLLLGGEVSRCIIPASRAYQFLTPWGSHPALDPLWSTEALEFIHDGAEAVRHEKLRVVAEDSLGRSEIRVCLQAINGRQAYNCGKCEKCLVTMVALQLLGLLGDATTFPPLDLELIKTMSPRAIGTLRALSTRPEADAQTVRALEDARHYVHRKRRIAQIPDRARNAVRRRRQTSVAARPAARVARTAWKTVAVALVEDTSDSYAASNVFLRRPDVLWPRNSSVDPNPGEHGQPSH